MMDSHGERGVDAFAELWARSARRGPRDHRPEHPHRQHRGAHRRLRRPRLPDLRPGRRLVVPRAVRAAPGPASPLGRGGLRLEEHAPRLQRAAPAGAARASSSTGAIAPTACPSGSSATGRRCRQDPRCWRRRRTPSSCPSSADARPTAASRRVARPDRGRRQRRSSRSPRPRRPSPRPSRPWSDRRPSSGTPSSPSGRPRRAESEALAARAASNAGSAPPRRRGGAVTLTQRARADGPPGGDVARLPSARPGPASTLPCVGRRLVPRPASTARSRSPQPDAHLHLARGRGSRDAARGAGGARTRGPWIDWCATPSAITPATTSRSCVGRP